MLQSKEEYLEIIRSHGFDGDLANLLADLFAHYSERYLADVLGQYYNSSVLKATNMDSLLQLALDMGYPVFRGTNTIIEFNVQRVRNIVSLQPLQEIFSYASNFFYFANESPILLTPETGYGINTQKIRLVHSTLPKRVLEFTLDKNEINVIDDKYIISEHLAFYVLYNVGGVNYIDHIRHTRWPRNFWSYVLDKENPSINLYDVLVLTTPDFGINVKFSEKVMNFTGTRKIRLEYLNFTGELMNIGVLAKLYQFLVDSLGLVLVKLDVSNSAEDVSNYFKLFSSTLYDDEKKIRSYLTEGTRFNGIIRSVSDVKTMIFEEFVNDIYDIRSYHYIAENNVPNSSPVPNIFYLILVIPKPHISIDEIEYKFQTKLINAWYSNFPRLNLVFIDSPRTNIDTLYQVSGVATNGLSISPDNIIITQPAPIILKIRYSFEGSNKDLVKAYISEYVARYVNKIIDSIEPGEIFSYFNKNSNVKKTLFFEISAITKDINGSERNVVYFRFIDLSSTVHSKSYDDIARSYIRDAELILEKYNDMENSPYSWSQYLKLIKFDLFYANLLKQENIFKYNVSREELDYYFQYISETIVVDMSPQD